MRLATSDRVAKKSNRCEAREKVPGLWAVTSPSGSTYEVDLNRGGLCSCPWGQKGNAGCSHERAARKAHAEQYEGRKVSFLPGDAAKVSRAQHKATRPMVQGMAMVLRDRITTADKIWNSPMPAVHTTGNLLAEDDGFRFYATNDGESWQISAHKRQGKYWPQTGQTFYRSEWGFRQSRQDFDAWFQEVTT